MKKGERKELRDSGQGLLIDTVLDVGSETVGEIAKESIGSALGDILVDGVSSLVPGLSGAISGYKRARFERNIKRFSEELAQRVDEIKSNLEKKSEEQKSKIDQLFTYVLDYIIDEQQEEKIKYMVNGFVTLTEHERITDDFVLTYYDILKDLRMVDLSVLKLMYSSNYNIDVENTESYIDVMERHGLNYEQYESVRRNVKRVGLLNTKADINIVDDMKEISTTFKNLYKYLEKLSDPKNKRPLPKLKEPTFKSRDNLQISKFGKDFVEFFMNLSREKNN